MAKKIKLDKFHIHEAMDRIEIINLNIEDHIIGHPAIFFNEDLKKMAVAAQKNLSDLYQALGLIKIK